MRDKQRPRDPNVAAQGTIEQIIDMSADPPTRKNPAAVELGRLGGLKGGRARAASLTPEQRSHIARRAAQARWDTQSE